MDRVFQWLCHPPTNAPRPTVLLRLMAGGVFLWEGVLKFVYANQGVGRFTKLGFPAPAVTADLVALLEIVGGLLLLAGFLTVLHEIRSEYAQLLTVLFLFLAGPGPWSVDAVLAGRAGASRRELETV